MRPREDEGTYRSRVAEIRRLLDSARADVEGRRFDSALATLKEVESRTVPTDEARRRAQAIAVQVAERRQQAADDLVAAGERAQAAGELLRAYEDFSKARDMGVAGMDQRLAQLRVAMARQGELALSEARNHDASGDLAKAIRAYERAFDYLPSEDPRREQARRRLVELRGR